MNFPYMNYNTQDLIFKSIRTFPICFKPHMILYERAYEFSVYELEHTKSYIDEYNNFSCMFQTSYDPI